jgi:hypothetical protein
VEIITKLIALAFSFLLGHLWYAQMEKEGGEGQIHPGWAWFATLIAVIVIIYKKVFYE